MYVCLLTNGDSLYVSVLKNGDSLCCQCMCLKMVIACVSVIANVSVLKNGDSLCVSVLKDW